MQVIQNKVFSTDYKSKNGLGYKILSLPKYLDDSWTVILTKIQ